MICIKSINILKEITQEDLSETHWEISEAIGLNNLVSLSEILGGTSVYIPTKKVLFKNFIYRKVFEEYNGDNTPALCNKYDLSMSTIYRIVTSGRSYKNGK